MPTPQELEAKLWKALDSDRTVMLGLDGAEDGHTRPMTAQVEADRLAHLVLHGERQCAGEDARRRCGPRDCHVRVERTRRVRHLPWAIESRHGSRRRRSTWNRFVAAWYPGGKTDPIACLAAPRSGARGNLAGRLESRRRGVKTPPRRGSAQELPGQSRASSAGPLTPILRTVPRPSPLHKRSRGSNKVNVMTRVAQQNQACDQRHAREPADELIAGAPAICWRSWNDQRGEATPPLRSRVSRNSSPRGTAWTISSRRWSRARPQRAPLRDSRGADPWSTAAIGSA